MQNGIRQQLSKKVPPQKSKLGIFVAGEGNWLGGKYYLQSLAANLSENPEFSKKWQLVQIGGEDGFLPGAEKIRRREKGGILEKVWRYRCDVIFPYTPPHRFRFGAAKAMGWIYDLQHADMPGMFQEGEIRFREKYFQRTLVNTETTLVSSRTMLDRVQERWPVAARKARVLHFSAKISPGECRRASRSVPDRLPENFFLCPYQLWKHKNHDLLLQALEICQNLGAPQTILCTGDASDFRNPEYPAAFKAKIRERGLAESLRFLGKLERSELLVLMIKAKALVLPSLYEGWSTVLEEAKALGQNCLVSDIPVHREQEYAAARYFPVSRAEPLANLLMENWHPPSLDKIETNVTVYQAIRREAGEKFLHYLNQIQ